MLHEIRSKVVRIPISKFKMVLFLSTQISAYALYRYEFSDNIDLATLIWNECEIYPLLCALHD